MNTAQRRETHNTKVQMSKSVYSCYTSPFSAPPRQLLSYYAFERLLWNGDSERIIAHRPLASTTVGYRPSFALALLDGLCRHQRHVMFPLLPHV